jgi:aryl-alcohol dehydrogenase-like predicted oxidoreductase
MEQRRFGDADLMSSVIGFGTWPIGGARYGCSDDAAALDAIRAALDAGITCFDTAPSYGNGHAEELLGKALAGRRHEVVIATKGGLIWDEDSQVHGRDSTGPYLERHLDASLRRLGTDYVDLYLIHWPDTSTPLAETMAVLEGFVRAGKVRRIGVSNFRAEQLRTAAAALTEFRLAANQVSFSLFDRRWRDDGFATCRALGIGAMAYGPLAHGLLAGAITRETLFDDDDWRGSGVFFGQPLLTPENRERNHAVVDRLAAIAADLGASLPQLATAWVLADPTVTVALVGARNRGEIESAAGAAKLTLTPVVMARIDDAMTQAAGLTTEMLA